MNSNSQFRNLAFELQQSCKKKKINILLTMIKIYEIEKDERTSKRMKRTIEANIINHNLNIGINLYGIKKYNSTSSVAAKCE